MESQFDEAGLRGQKRLSSTPTAQVGALACAGPQSRVASGTSHLIFLLCILALFLRLMFQCYEVYYIATVGQVGSKIVRTATAAPVFVAFLIFLFSSSLQGPVVRGTSVLKFLIIAVCFSGCAMLVVEGWTLRYFLGDLFRFTIPWMSS